MGIDRSTRRPKIADDVLQGMRVYLLIGNEKDKIIREERVKSTVQEVMKDSMSQKTILRLEPLPLISHGLDKGKGLVFNYEKLPKPREEAVQKKKGDMILRDAIVSGKANSRKPVDDGF